MIIKKSIEFSKDLAFLHSNYNHLLLHHCNNLFHFYIYCIIIIMISGSKGQKAVHACMIRLLNLGPAEHEEVAIYIVNQRIPNVRELREQLCREAIRGY